eukprot:m.131200 g.131200  ORF g.131200 m.131200 type:complete len:780 (-) comp13070_c0_seq2:1491-3830(-)
MGGSQSVLQFDNIDFGVEIDDFEVKYVGSVPIKVAKGNDIAKNAVERLRALKGKEKPILLKVTTVGVFIIDAKAGDILKEVNIKDITFVAQDSFDDQLVSFFENDLQSRLITCHTFRVRKNAHEIPVAINESFKALKGEDVEAKDEKKGGKIRRRSTSKKDALRASTAKRKEMDKGDLKETYPGVHLGTVNVSSPKGEEVILEGAERVLKLESKPVKSELRVYTKAFEVFNVKKEIRIQLQNVRDISFAKTLKGDPLMVAYIIHDRRLDKMTCSVFQPDPIEEGRPSIRRSIDQAQKAIVADLKAKKADAIMEKIMDGGKAPAKDDVDHATGKIIGVFECSYLGSNVVNELKGADVVSGAVAAVLKVKNTPQGVFFHVGTEGVKMFDALTHEVISSFVLKDVSYTSVSGKNKDLFAFVQKDDSLNIINCHIFKCAGERAFDIATAMRDAFVAAAEEAKKTGGNPFKAYGEREAPPGELFKRQVHRVDLIPRKAIGAGQFGQVFLAEQAVADGVGDNGSNRASRAVKMLRGGASALDKEEFISEAMVMLEFDHENLVQLIGVSMQQRPWLMVLEFVQYGDLRNVLKGCKARGITLTYEEQLTFASQVAFGMEHIASLHMVHMDLAARNVLVHNNNQVKVADFGLTRKLPEGEDHWQSKSVMKLPVKWCSIEALDDRLFSEGSDVWAFGIVMWEIMSYGALPYGKLKTQEVQRKVRSGLRLDKAEGCPDEFHQLASSCWEAKRLDRPSFANLASELKTYLRTHSTGAVRDIGLTLKESISQ